MVRFAVLILRSAAVRKAPAAARESIEKLCVGGRSAADRDDTVATVVISRWENEVTKETLNENLRYPIHSGRLI